MPSKPNAPPCCGSRSPLAEIDWRMRREHFGEATPEAAGAFLNEATRKPSCLSARIETPGAAFVVPPSMALFLPAHAPRGIRRDGPVAMRALFLREDAAARARAGTDVIAVSPLLREVVLAACAEPLHWDRRGRGGWLAELALDEIARGAWRTWPSLRARPAGRWHDCSGPKSDLVSANGDSRRAWPRRWAPSTGTIPARAAVLAGFAGQAAFGAAFRDSFGMTPRAGAVSHKDALAFGCLLTR